MLYRWTTPPRRVGAGRGWLAGDTVGLAGWPVSASQEQTLSGIGARVYTALRDWLSVVTGISAASTGGVLVHTIDADATKPSIRRRRCALNSR